MQNEKLIWIWDFLQGLISPIFFSSLVWVFSGITLGGHSRAVLAYIFFILGYHYLARYYWLTRPGLSSGILWANVVVIPMFLVELYLAISVF